MNGGMGSSQSFSSAYKIAALGNFAQGAGFGTMDTPKLSTCFNHLFYKEFLQKHLVA